MIITMVIVLLTTAVLYPVISRLTRRITRYSAQLLKANLDALETLGDAIAKRDSDTNAHNYRVRIYAARIGEEMELPNQTMRTLIKGSFLHDVGKIGIPDEVLLKPGKLDDKEFEIMKTHVEQGFEIICMIDSGEKKRFSGKNLVKSSINISMEEWTAWSTEFLMICLSASNSPFGFKECLFFLYPATHPPQSKTK